MKKLTLVILSAAALAGCATGARRAAPPAAAPAAGTGACPPCPAVAVSTKAPEAAFLPSGAPAAFLDSDDLKPLLKAAYLNRDYFKGLKCETPAYMFGARKVTARDLAAATDELIRILESSPTPDQLDAQVRQKFDVYQMAGRDSTGTVVFSSYYEPTIEASLKYGGPYKLPIYAKPDDLVTVNLGDFNDKFKGEKISGRVQNGSLVPYLTREQIDFDKGLDKKGLELAYLKSWADVMDLHTEGSARLALPDGRVVKAKYAANNSFPFKGWLTAMIESGVLERAGISPEKGQKYLDEHPAMVRKILSMNRRYVFFKLEQPADPEEGPNGTYGLPLVGWRSVAVDNALVPMGALAFMAVPTAPDVNAKGELLGRKPDSRFVFCQDTGGAIKGPGRVDFYAGNGRRSTTFAFKLWDPGQMYILLLKEQPAAAI